MSDFIQEFQFYMSYPFVRYALIVGVLVAAVMAPMLTMYQAMDSL